MYNQELKVMLEACKMAREHILKVYHEDFKVEIKEDKSPVTKADKGADMIISKHLKENFPHYALLTEESLDDKNRLKNDYVFIVDPVDGTEDFIHRNDEFTTNIALAYRGEIVAGVVAIPAKNELYYATKGDGAYYIDSNNQKTKIHVNDKLTDLTQYISRFHADLRELNLKEHYPQITRLVKSGSSIKACLISKGEGEVYYRVTPHTKEWDIAAFDIIVKEAGGVILKPDGKKITYNREDVYNREGFVVLNRIENLFKI